MTQFPSGVPASQQRTAHPVNGGLIIWGPFTVVNTGIDRERILSDSVFLVWSNRQLYAIHWRMPVDMGEHEEAVYIPAAGDRGLTELWHWLTDLRILVATQIAGALAAAAPFLHAMDPNTEHVTALLQHPYSQVRTETQRNLESHGNGAMDSQGEASSGVNGNPTRHSPRSHSRRLPS